MNERIQELMEQADYNAPGGKWKEYFAELIVRECAEVLVTWNKENGAEEGLDKEGLISLWSSHFGVTE